MTEPAPPPAKDASAAEIEADIQATRERLAESVDALADKVNVKARAQEKVDQTKQQAREKVDETRQQVRDKADQTRQQVRDKANQARTKGTELLGQAKQAPRPVQLALVAAPALVLVVLIIGRIRRRRLAVVTSRT